MACVSAVVAGRLGAGPGVAGPKSRCSGCEPAALETESFPGCPPGSVVLAAAALRAPARSRAQRASLIGRVGQRSASLRVFPAASFRSWQPRPSLCLRRIWVIAAVWIAWP